MDDFDTGGNVASDDARHKGQAALDKARGVSSDAQQVAGDAVDASRAYAKGAIHAAGKKIDGATRQLSETTDHLTKAINDDPIKAVLITAVVSSLLTALLMAALRTDDRYY